MKSCFLVAAAVLALAACGGGGGSGGGDGGAGGIAAGGSGGGSAGTGGTPGTGGSGGSAGSAGDGGSGGAGGDGGTAGQGGDDGAGGSGGTPAKRDVVGTIVDGAGEPVSGVMVAIDGRYDEFVITGADGTFRFEEVDDAYSLTVSDGDEVFVHLASLRRRNPVVALSGAMSIGQETAASGSVTSDDPERFPLSPGRLIQVSVSGRPFIPVDTDRDGVFNGRFVRFGLPRANEAVHAVAALMESDLDGNLRILDTGRVSNLNFGAGPLSGLEIPLGEGPAPTGTTTFSVDPGAYSSGFDIRLASFEVKGVQFAVLLGGSLGVTDGASRELPSIGTQFIASGRDVNGTQAVFKVAGDFGGTTKVELPADSLLKAVTPVNEATGVASHATLGWTPVAGATAYWITVQEPGGRERDYVVPASVSTLKIGDSGVLAGPLGAGARVSWRVTALVGSQFDADGLTDGTGQGMWRVYLDPRVRGVFVTADRFFTTAP